MSANTALRNGTIACLAVTVILDITISPAIAKDELVCLAPRKPNADLHVLNVAPKQVFDDLIGWLAMNTSYDLILTYHSPPTVSFCDVGDFVDYEGKKLLVEKELRAAFDYPNRHILLVRPWSAENYFDQSVLLHELIHDVQLSNREWECLGAPELEAYLLQHTWLREHGINYSFNWPAILSLSVCPVADEAEREKEP